MKMKMANEESTTKWGVNPIIWTNDDFDKLKAPLTIQNLLSNVESSGFEYVEWGHLFESSSALSYFLDSSVKLLGGWHSLHLLENDLNYEWNQIHQRLEELNKFGAQYIIFCDCSYSFHKKEDLFQGPHYQKKFTLSQMQDFYMKLDNVFFEIKKNSITPVYHHHFGTLIDSPRKISQMLENTTHVSLLFDTGHFGLFDQDILKFFKKWENRIKYIHYKNLRMDVRNKLFKNSDNFSTAVEKGLFCVPGHPEGILNYKGIYKKNIPQVIEAEHNFRTINCTQEAINGRRHIDNIIKG